MNVDDEIVMCVCVCVCVSVVGRSLVGVLVHVAVADLRRLYCRMLALACSD